MLNYEFSLYWSAAGFYALGAIICSFKTFGISRKWQDLDIILTSMGLVAHTIALLLRWKISGHGPYLDTFEVISSDVWMLVSLFLAVSFKNHKLRFLGIIVLPIALLLLGFSVMSAPEIKMLPASFYTYWLIIHILFAKLTLATLLISVACALFFIKKDGKDVSYLTKLPSPAKLDMLSYRYCALAFTFWTTTIIAGAIWANKSWGRYWGWDPIEVWSLICWLILGINLHLRRFHGLSGKKAAVFIMVCFFALILTGYLIPFSSATIHTEYLQ